MIEPTKSVLAESAKTDLTKSDSMTLSDKIMRKKKKRQRRKQKKQEKKASAVSSDDNDSNPNNADNKTAAEDETSSV